MISTTAIDSPSVLPNAKYIPFEQNSVPKVSLMFEGQTFIPRHSSPTRKRTSLIWTEKKKQIVDLVQHPAESTLAQRCCDSQSTSAHSVGYFPTEVSSISRNQIPSHRCVCNNKKMMTMNRPHFFTVARHDNYLTQIKPKMTDNVVNNPIKINDAVNKVYPTNCVIPVPKKILVKQGMLATQQSNYQTANDIVLDKNAPILTSLKAQKSPLLQSNRCLENSSHRDHKSQTPPVYPIQLAVHSKPSHVLCDRNHTSIFKLGSPRCRAPRAENNIYDEENLAVSRNFESKLKMHSSSEKIQSMDLTQPPIRKESASFPPSEMQHKNYFENPLIPSAGLESLTKSNVYFQRPKNGMPIATNIPCRIQTFMHRRRPMLHCNEEIIQETGIDISKEGMAKHYSNSHKDSEKLLSIKSIRPKKVQQKKNSSKNFAKSTNEKLSRLQASPGRKISNIKTTKTGIGTSGKDNQASQPKAMKQPIVTESSENQIEVTSAPERNLLSSSGVIVESRVLRENADKNPVSCKKVECDNECFSGLPGKDILSLSCEQLGGTANSQKSLDSVKKSVKQIDFNGIRDRPHHSIKDDVSSSLTEKKGHHNLSTTPSNGASNAPTDYKAKHYGIPLENLNNKQAHNGQEKNEKQQPFIKKNNEYTENDLSPTTKELDVSKKDEAAAPTRTTTSNGDAKLKKKNDGGLPSIQLSKIFDENKKPPSEISKKNLSEKHPQPTSWNSLKTTIRVLPGENDGERQDTATASTTASTSDATCVTQNSLELFQTPDNYLKVYQANTKSNHLAKSFNTSESAFRPTSCSEASPQIPGQQSSSAEVARPAQIDSLASVRDKPGQTKKSFEKFQLQKFSTENETSHNLFLKETKELKKSIICLREQNKRSKKEIHESQKKHESLLKKIEVLQSELENLTTEKGTLETRLRDFQLLLKHSSEQHESSLRELIQKIEEKRRTIKMIAHQRDEALTRLQDLVGRQTALTSKLSGLQKHNYDLKQRVFSLESKYETLKIQHEKNVEATKTNCDFGTTVRNNSNYALSANAAFENADYCLRKKSKASIDTGQDNEFRMQAVSRPCKENCVSSKNDSSKYESLVNTDEDSDFMQVYQSLGVGFEDAQGDEKSAEYLMNCKLACDSDSLSRSAERKQAKRQDKISIKKGINSNGPLYALDNVLISKNAIVTLDSVTTESNTESLKKSFFDFLPDKTSLKPFNGIYRNASDGKENFMDHRPYFVNDDDVYYDYDDNDELLIYDNTLSAGATIRTNTPSFQSSETNSIKEENKLYSNEYCKKKLSSLYRLLLDENNSQSLWQIDGIECKALISYIYRREKNFCTQIKNLKQHIARIGEGMKCQMRKSKARLSASILMSSQESNTSQLPICMSRVSDTMSEQSMNNMSDDPCHQTSEKFCLSIARKAQSEILDYYPFLGQGRVKSKVAKQKKFKYFYRGSHRGIHDSRFMPKKFHWMQLKNAAIKPSRFSRIHSSPDFIMTEKGKNDYRQNYKNFIFGQDVCSTAPKFPKPQNSSAGNASLSRENIIQRGENFLTCNRTPFKILLENCDSAEHNLKEPEGTPPLNEKKQTIEQLKLQNFSDKVNLEKEAGFGESAKDSRSLSTFSTSFDAMKFRYRDSLIGIVMQPRHAKNTSYMLGTVGQLEEILLGIKILNRLKQYLSKDSIFQLDFYHSVSDFLSALFEKRSSTFARQFCSKLSKLVFDLKEAIGCIIYKHNLHKLGNCEPSIKKKNGSYNLDTGFHGFPMAAKAASRKVSEDMLEASCSAFSTYSPRTESSNTDGYLLL